jgi:phage shock protein PspC (stress-responsive transcriptional regulator)
VCAGVAEYFGVDVVIVRIAAVVLAFSGPGLLAYGLAWIFVPEAGPDEAARPAAEHGHHDRGAQIFGIILLAVAVSILWGGWWSPARRWIFPFGLIVLGGWLILRRDDHDRADPGREGAAAAAEEPVPASPAAPREAAATHEVEAGSPPSAADPTVDPTVERQADDPTWPWRGAPGWPGAPRPWQHRQHEHNRPLTEEERAARRRRRMVFPVVMGALLLWTGVAFLAGVAIQTGLAIALCIVGMGFVLGAFVGGSKALILPALVLAVALTATSVLDLPLEGPMGSRTWRPDQVSGIDDHYKMSMGEGTIDLTGLDLAGQDEIGVRASLGIGHLVVRVPTEVALEVHAQTSAGEVKILGLADNGVGVSTDRRYGTGAYDTTLVLDLEVGLGQIEVVALRDGGRAVRAGATATPEPTTAPEPTTGPDPTTPRTLG